jgi:hypothetical protein
VKPIAHHHHAAGKRRIRRRFDRLLTADSHYLEFSTPPRVPIPIDNRLT